MLHTKCLLLCLLSISTTNGVVRFGGDTNVVLTAQKSLRIDRQSKINFDNSIESREIFLPNERPERKLGEIIEFELFYGDVVRGTVTRLVDRGVKGATWSGSLEPSNEITKDVKSFEDRFTLTCYLEACTAQIILESSDSHYVIKPAVGAELSSSGAGMYRLSKVGERPKSGTTTDDRIPVLDDHDKALQMNALSRQQTAADVDQDLIIDIGVLYTPESMSLMGYSHAAMVAHIQSVNDDGNAICQRSKVAVRYRLVFILPTADPNFKEPANTAAGFSALLNWLRQRGDGKFEEVHSYRDQYAADFVVLFQRANTFAGSAYVLNDFAPNWAFGNYAVEYTDGRVWAHELGHLQGCEHDRISKNADPNSPFLGYGSCWEDSSRSDCTCYKSVMVYQCNTMPNNCKSCRSRDYYSNMNVVNAGNPTGEKLASCALHINEQRFRPITYRKAVHDSGMIFSVSPTSVQVAECASIIISGWRIGYGGTIVSVTLAGVEADILSSNINSVTVRSPWVHSVTTEPGAVVVTTDAGRVTTLYGAFSFVTGSADGSECTQAAQHLPGDYDPVYEWNEAKSFDGHSTGYLYDSLLRSLSDELTISLWIQTTVSNRYLVSLGKSPIHTSAYFVLQIDETGRLNFFDYNEGGHGFLSTAGSSDVMVNTGALTHVAFVKSGNSGTYYVNGIASGHMSASKSVIYDNHDLAVGYNYQDHDGYFEGDMDNIKIYKTALSSEHIMSLYTSNAISDSSNSPTTSPTLNPTAIPSNSRPSNRPTTYPTRQPQSPTRWPSLVPTMTPPSRQPHSPSAQPTVFPTTTSPTHQPQNPSMLPTSVPTSPTITPNSRPTTDAVISIEDSITFNGVSNSVHYDTISEPLSDTFTISMWITTTKSNKILMTLGRSPSEYFNEFLFYINWDGKLAFYDYGTWFSGYGYRYAGGFSDTTVTSGERTHVGFIKDGTTGTFYINGQPAGQITASYSVNYGDKDLVIGYDYREDRQYFEGEMDNIKLISKALSPSVMTTLYMANTPTTTPTLAPVSTPTTPFLPPTNTPSSVPAVSVLETVFSLTGPATFNGEYNQISVNDLSGIQTVSDISISMWITTTNTQQYLVSLARSWTNYNNQFAFYIHTDGRLTFFDYGDASGGYGFEYMSGFSNVAVNTGERTHVGFIKDGTTGTFYINGQFAGQITASYSVNYQTKELSIGVDPYYDSKYFKGEIDHLDVFDKVLTAEDMHLKYLMDA